MSQPRPGIRVTPRAIRAATRKPSLVVLGDLLLEVAATPAQTIEKGTDVPGLVRIRRGGSAANVAVVFAGLGGRAALVSSIGRDAVGRHLVQAVRDEGVTLHIVRVAAPTARLLALVDLSGERSFVTERAAADRLSAADVRAGWFRGSGALHLPGYSLYNRPVSEAASEAVRLIRARNGNAAPIVSIDLSSRGPLLAFGRQAAWELIGGLAPDVLFANASEAVALARAAASRKLLELAPTVVIKEGSSGCRILWRDPSDAVLQLVVATTPVATTDTTGAGDAFAAGFLFTLLGGPATQPSFPPLSAALLRRAALAGHRSAANLLRGARPELAL